MNIPDALLPSSWYQLAHLLALLLAWRAWRHGALEGLLVPWRLNLFLGTVVALTVLWSIKTGVKPGLNFHVLGATALTLMFGGRIALFAIALVLVAVNLAGEGAWQALSLNFLVMGAVPVLVSQTIYTVVDRHLPNHFMVYIFLCGFFGAALAMGATGLVATAVMYWSGTYTWEYLRGDYLPYFVLLAWSEAWLTGMSVSLMAAYRPEWVSTFDDARYLRR